MKLVDLTMSLDEETPTHPDDPEVEAEEVTTVEKDGYAVKRLWFPSHVGTHIDAPAHMLEDGKTVDDYGVETFVGEGVVVDVQGQEVIEVGKDRLDDADMVFFHTGHAKRAHNGRSEDYHDGGPVVSERTAEAVVETGVDVFGIDAPSPDEPPYPVHDMLLGNDVVILENLVNLGAVGERQFRCYALPLNVVGGDGAPCRVIAVLD
jgi:kynurenine formamidase